MRHAFARLHTYATRPLSLVVATPLRLEPVKVGFVVLDAFSGALELDRPKLVSFLRDVEASYREVP